MIATRYLCIALKNLRTSKLNAAFLSTLPLPKEDKINVGKYKINYIKVGHGPHNILCAPGALGSIWTDFKLQVEGIDREKFSLHVWDPPGYGKSIPPEREFNINFYENDADVAYEFMKELNVTKYSLLGWSDGGISSMILAAKYPDVVSKLVIWGANSFILPKELESYKRALGSIWTDFKHQVGGFDEEKFTVIFWDPPGFGKSRPPLREFSTKFYFNDARVSSLLMKELNIPRYSLLGWSNGSITSMVHAANHPDCVQKLVIWGANCFILPEEAAHYKDMKDVSLWSKKMKQPMIDMYGEELFASYWIQWVDSMDELIRNTGGDVCSTLVPQIKCPTLILYGEKDPLVRRVHLEYLQKHIKNHQTHLYPDGKHNIHIRHYEDFNRRVQAFLLS